MAVCVSLNRYPDKCSFSPSADMVMYWARELYRKGAAARYLKKIDLSASSAIRKECEEICGWYKEVILNRKYLIRFLAREWLKQADGLRQVFIPASGRSPLALELLERYGDKVSQVVEIDIRGLDEKREDVCAVALRVSGKIKFISADISSKHCFNALKLSGRTPSLIILEGISYYILKDALKRVIGACRSRDKSNLLVLEYLLPRASVSRERRAIPEKVFSVMKSSGGLSSIIRYSRSGVRGLLSSCGVKGGLFFTLKDMELLRKGTNRYFNNDAEGWIECLCARV